MATKRPAKRKTTTRRPAKPVTARQLLRAIAELQEQRGLDEAVLFGALCEVIAGHQPTARQAVGRIAGMLDAAGIR
jgi:hypothetical protein